MRTGTPTGSLLAWLDHGQPVEHRPRIALWSTLSLLLLAAAASAAATEVTVSPEAPDPALSVPVDPTPPGSIEPAVRRWRPPAPTPVEFEWIRLTSGEWLKGEVKVMRENVLEFDSDELDLLKFEWEDIAEIHSPRANTYVFRHRRVLNGATRVTLEEVIVQTEEGEQILPRADLISIVRGGQSEIDMWSAKISVGLTARSGNTNQTEFSTLATVKREGSFARFLLDYRGNFGEIEGVENVNSHKADASLDLFVSDRFFVRPASLGVFSDKFQNIALRITPGVGGGMTLVDHERLEWDVQIGGVYRFTRHESVPISGDLSERSPALAASTRFESVLTKRIDLDGDYSTNIGIPDTDDTTQHALLVLSVEMTDLLDLDVSLSWDRVGQPVPDSSGRFPETDDFRLSVGIGIDF